MTLADKYFKMAEEQDDQNLKMVLNAAGTAIQNLKNKLNKAGARLTKLEALEAYGVDNWEGYDEAMRSIDSNDEDEED